MDPVDLADVERQAAEIAWGAGRILLARLHQPLTVEWKGKREGDDPVTNADHEAEALVREELRQRFPSHAIVGEEGAGTGSAAAPWTWVVDPLDGTTNFLNGLPAFACSIGLLENGVPVAAAIFVPWPVTDGGVVLHARTGGGTWLGDRRLSLSGDPSLAGRLVVLPRGPFRYRGPFRRTFGERRSVGSIAYELAATAQGIYRYVLLSSPKVWDVAAGVLLVAEAGGAVVTRRRGSKEWTPFRSFAEEPDRKRRLTTSPDHDELPVPGQEELRKWARPILAGTVPAVQQAVVGIQPYYPLFPRALRLVRLALGTDRQRQSKHRGPNPPQSSPRTS